MLSRCHLRGKKPTIKSISIIPIQNFPNIIEPLVLYIYIFFYFLRFFFEHIKLQSYQNMLHYHHSQALDTMSLY